MHKIGLKLLIAIWHAAERSFNIRKFKLIWLMALAMSLPAQADTFKCSKNGGIVYSDKPCETDSKIVNRIASKTPSNDTQDENPITVGSRVCGIEGPRRIIFKDPGSVQIGTVTGGEMAVIPYLDSQIAARHYIVPVNAKNSFGGYVGQRPLHCWTSQDGRRIVKLDDTSLDKEVL